MREGVYRKRMEVDRNKMRCRYRRGELGVTNPESIRNQQKKGVQGVGKRLGRCTQPNPVYHADSKQFATTEFFSR